MRALVLSGVLLSGCVESVDPVVEDPTDETTEALSCPTELGEDERHVTLAPERAREVVRSDEGEIVYATGGRVLAVDVETGETRPLVEITRDVVAFVLEDDAVVYSDGAAVYRQPLDECP